VLISRTLGFCATCIKEHFAEVSPGIEKAHAEARKPFGLPARPPRAENGVRCRVCINECSIPQGERSYCGLKTSVGGRLAGVVGRGANVSWYYDPLPTNCVADWVCPGGTGVGYPRFAYRDGPEYGYKNLAVFYQACSFDCLFCQNWHFREVALAERSVSAAQLAEQVDEATSCICYFGGDPTPQLPHAILVSRLAVAGKRSGLLRICWETNGSMHPSLLEPMARLSLDSGGCIKFDLKAWSEKLHLALCGVSNRRTLDNFRRLAGYISQRPTPPFLVASTLLVPGYVDSDEVSRIAGFISSLSRDIPYSLLGFCPQFYMDDLPTTSRRHAEECVEAARAAGLRKVRIGNRHLLGNAY